jgi:hypothetical protein
MIDNVTRENVFVLIWLSCPKGSFTIATVAYQTHYTPCSAVKEKAAGSSHRRYISITSHTRVIFNKLRTGKTMIEVPMKGQSKISKPRVGQPASVENRTRDIPNTKKCHQIDHDDPSERESEPEIWSLKPEQCHQVSASYHRKCPQKCQNMSGKIKSLHPWKCSGTAGLHCHVFTHNNSTRDLFYL